MRKISLFLMSLFLATSFSAIQPTKKARAMNRVESASETDMITDNELVSTYEHETTVRNLPTLIVDIESRDDLDGVVTTNTSPSNVILHFDENGNIIDKDGNVIDSFINVYNEINPFVIPILSIQDEKSMNAFLQLSKTKIDLLDMAVLSNKPDIVKTIREENSKIRGIIEYNQLSKEESLYETVVSPTNANLAQVAILSSSDATKENVTYIQARFKTVWTRLDQETDFDVYAALQTGTYGLIVKNYEHIYELFEQLEEGSTFRPFFNVGHRGLPKQAHENSLSGIKKAMEVGATHVELDAYVTKDDQIYFMHDANIARTTNGNGALESFTSDELEQFELDVYKPNEKIPSIDDIIPALKGTSTILVLEIKTEKAIFPSLLKEKLDEYDFYDQIVMISFSTKALERVKNELPMIPTAYLGTVNEKTFNKSLTLLGKLNAGVDASLGSFSKEFNELYLRDRGFIGWYWTIDTVYDMRQKAIQNGIVGITSNIADFFQKIIYEVKGNNIQLEKEQVFNKDVPVTLTATTYTGNEIEVEGKIISYKEKGEGKHLVIASYKDEISKMTYYSNPFEILDGEKDIVVDPPVNPPKKSGCQKSATAIIISFSAIIFLGAFLLKKNSYVN